MTCNKCLFMMNFALAIVCYAEATITRENPSSSNNAIYSNCNGNIASASTVILRFFQVKLIL